MLVCMCPLMVVTPLSSALENFLLLWRGFYISSGTQFWKCSLTFILMKCGALKLSGYLLLAKMLRHSFIMTSLWCVLSFEAGELVNFITGYRAVNRCLFRLLSNIIRIDHLPHTWLFVFLFYLVSKPGMKLDLLRIVHLQHVCLLVY